MDPRGGPLGEPSLPLRRSGRVFPPLMVSRSLTWWNWSMFATSLFPELQALGADGWACSLRWSLWAFMDIRFHLSCPRLSSLGSRRFFNRSRVSHHVPQGESQSSVAPQFLSKLLGSRLGLLGSIMSFHSSKISLYSSIVSLERSHVFMVSINSWLL